MADWIVQIPRKGPFVAQAGSASVSFRERELSTKRLDNTMAYAASLAGIAWPGVLLATMFFFGVLSG